MRTNKYISFKSLQKEEKDMLKKLKNWMAIVVLAVAMCLNCGVVSARNNDEMDPDDLIYECDTVTFRNSGVLKVEGTFYNLSDDYDIVGLKDIDFSIVNSNNQELVSVNIEKSNIKLIAHNNETDHSFEVEVNGNTQQYKNATAVLKKVTFSWVKCTGKNCSYCGGSNGNSSNNRKSTNNNVSSSDDYDYWMTCASCKGTGTCKKCGGTGRQRNGRMCPSCDGTGDCSVCEGLGERKLLLIDGKEYVECGACHGDTKCTSCDGTGKSSSEKFPCFRCGGSGVCDVCRGKGYT